MSKKQRISISVSLDPQGLVQGQVNKRENEWWSAALSSAIKSSVKGTEKCSLSLAVKRSWVINWVITFLWSAWCQRWGRKDSEDRQLLEGIGGTDVGWLVKCESKRRGLSLCLTVRDVGIYTHGGENSTSLHCSPGVGTSDALFLGRDTEVGWTLRSGVQMLLDFIKEMSEEQVEVRSASALAMPGGSENHLVPRRGEWVRG